MCMESKLCCGVAAMQLLLHGRYGQSCMQKLWSAQAVISLYGMCMLCSRAGGNGTAMAVPVFEGEKWRRLIGF